jgi:RNA polymerase sigma-70 factor (ECF subfamily)
MKAMPMTTTPWTDVALVAAVRANDPAGCEALVRQFGGRMRAVAMRLLGHEADANDAVQDAFVSAFRSIDRFDGKAALGTWLHRIAVNAALMRLRSRRRRPEVSIESLLPGFLADGHHADPPAAWQTSRTDPAERDELRKLVRDRINELPAGFRDIVLLRDIEGLDTEETARLLGLSENAAKTRLHRARQALRTLLDPHFREGVE